MVTSTKRKQYYYDKHNNMPITIFLPFLKFVKRPQTKFHTDTISESKVIVREIFFCNSDILMVLLRLLT